MTGLMNAGRTSADALVTTSIWNRWSGACVNRGVTEPSPEKFSFRTQWAIFRAQWADYSNPIRVAIIALLVALFPVIYILTTCAHGFFIAAFIYAASRLVRIIERDYPHHRR